MVLILVPQWAHSILKSYIYSEWNTSRHCRCFSDGARNSLSRIYFIHIYTGPVDECIQIESMGIIVAHDISAFWRKRKKSHQIIDKLCPYLYVFFSSSKRPKRNIAVRLRSIGSIVSSHPREFQLFNKQNRPQLTKPVSKMDLYFFPSSHRR